MMQNSFLDNIVVKGLLKGLFSTQSQNNILLQQELAKYIQLTFPYSQTLTEQFLHCHNLFNFIQ